MIRPPRRRPGEPWYHVHAADAAARQFGAILIVLSLSFLPAFNDARGRPALAFAGAATAMVAIGIAYFALGSSLARRRQIWVAHTLASLAGAKVIAAVGGMVVLHSGGRWPGGRRGRPRLPRRRHPAGHPGLLARVARGRGNQTCGLRRPRVRAGLAGTTGRE